MWFDTFVVCFRLGSDKVCAVKEHLWHERAAAAVGVRCVVGGAGGWANGWRVWAAPTQAAGLTPPLPRAYPPPGHASGCASISAAPRPVPLPCLVPAELPPLLVRMPTHTNLPPNPLLPARCPQNFFLYFYGMCFNFLGLLFVMATGSMRPATMLAGFRGVSAGTAGAGEGAADHRTPTAAVA